MKIFEPARKRYRMGFVESCLERAPAAAGTWYQQLCAIAEKEIAPSAAEIDRAGRYPTAAIAALARIGAFGVAVPKRHGGLGFGAAVAALAVETIAAACASTAAVMMFHYQVVRRVDRFGAKAWRAEDLRRLASGAWLGSSAWTEIGAGADKSTLKTYLRSAEGERRITGAKHFCTGIEGAAVVHVLLDAGPEDGPPAPTFVRVPIDRSRVDCSEVYPLLGLRGSSTGTVRFDGVSVPENCIVGQVGQGRALMRDNHEFLMNPGLIALGVGSVALESARNGALGRGAGARDITGFQATRFRLVEMETDLARTYALAAEAIRLVARRAADLNIECLKVKLIAGETAVEVAADAMRLAGGRGFHADWPYERHLRDAYATVLMGPANEIIKEWIAERTLADLPVESHLTQKILERMS